jgi:hypothetical protein
MLKGVRSYENGAQLPLPNCPEWRMHAWEDLAILIFSEENKNYK